MSTALRPLGDLRMTDAPEVGGKAASLGELVAAGVRVPDAVVLTATAATLAPEERRTLLEQGVRLLGDGTFAVRSSGISEDGTERSFAGMYESVLNVPVDGLAAAADRTLLSTRGAHLTTYAEAGNGVNAGLAIIVQRMVQASAAGVALTADPITGDRTKTIVTAVTGTGDRLVSGASIGDEWVVTDGRATVRRRAESAIDERQALAVAVEATRIAAVRNQPQDVEWAIDGDGTLWILQSRPMTALPRQVSWEPGAAGAFTRQLRLGEWIGAPVTSLFETWLLTAMENRMHAFYKAEIGQRVPRPYHVVVNGWYFYGLNFLSGGAMLRSLPGILWHLVREPRKAAGVLPATVRHGYPLMERMWRSDIQPRYQAVVADAASEVDDLPPEQLPPLVDRLAEAAGEYFASITALAGAGYKLEMNLARFYQRHVRPTLGGSHLPLLAGIEAPAGPAVHAVTSLDWWYPPLGEVGVARADGEYGRLVREREAAESAAEAALAGSPKRLREFRQLLADSQHLVPIREEQTSELTLPWPAMRRAVLRIGQALTDRGQLATADDVFFLTRDEVLAALVNGEAFQAPDISARRATREEQARLVPPLLIGRINPMLKRMWDSYPRMLGATPSERALVSGSPASAGRATGAVRVILGPDEFELLQPGEILVAPLTAPAWTPLFTRAAAVVTDVGSPAAHASIIAREYGIPAVVGCGDATARLTTGMRVTVDGSTGNVEPA
jgi:phosphohistidine swiveling domain-containing protein